MKELRGVGRAELGIKDGSLSLPLIGWLLRDVTLTSSVILASEWFITFPRSCDVSVVTHEGLKFIFDQLFLSGFLAEGE